MTLRLEIQDMEPEVTEKDLLSVYVLYPRRGPGKQDGLKVLRKTVRTKSELGECFLAVRAFVKAHQGKAKEYIRHFDRWARSWRDWLDIDGNDGLRDAAGSLRSGPGGVHQDSEGKNPAGLDPYAAKVKYTPPVPIDPISPEEARAFAAEQLERLRRGG